MSYADAAATPNKDTKEETTPAEATATPVKTKTSTPVKRDTPSAAVEPVCIALLLFISGC